MWAGSGGVVKVLKTLGQGSDPPEARRRGFLHRGHHDLHGIFVGVYHVYSGLPLFAGRARLVDVAVRRGAGRAVDGAILARTNGRRGFFNPAVHHRPGHVVGVDLAAGFNDDWSCHGPDCL